MKTLLLNFLIIYTLCANRFYGYITSLKGKITLPALLKNLLKPKEWLLRIKQQFL